MRISSATGAVPVITWPVISRSPVVIALRSRSSTGSMPSAAASLSICASCAKHTCTAPKPRIAPHGGLLVRTAQPSTRALGTSYGPAAKHARVDEHRPAGRRVGAAVEHDPGLDLDQPAVAGRVVAVAHARGVAVDVAEERLLAGEHHLHRPAGVQREQAEVDLQADVLAGAERAADAGEGHPHLVGRQAEAGGDLVAVDVQPLGRHVQVDAAVVVGDGEPGLGAHERLVLHADLVGALDDDLARGRRVAVADHQVAKTLPSGWIGSAVIAASASTSGVELLVVDDDGRDRPPGGVRVVGGDRGDRLAVVAHHVVREHRLVGVLEAVDRARRARRRR